MAEQEPVEFQKLSEELLAIDHARTRAELPEQWKAASHVLDAWLARAHGILATSHNELGWLLAMLDAEGYRVVPPTPAGTAEGSAVGGGR